MATPLFTNKAKSTLAQALAPSDGTAYLALGTGTLFPSPAAGNYFPAVLVRASDLAWEVVRCTSRTVDTVSLTRAQDGTTALAFVVGDKFELRVTKSVLEEFVHEDELQGIELNGTRSLAVIAGTADALTGALTPAATALVNGMEVRGRATAANATTTPTFNLDSLGAKTVVQLADAALEAGSIAGADHELTLRYNSTNDNWVLLNPSPVLDAPGNELFLYSNFT